MQNDSLHARITEVLSRQLDSFLGSQSDLKLIPVIGNGLSRLAVGKGLSWDDWIRDSLVQVGEPRELFDALRRRGLEHPEILHFVFEISAGRGLARESWKSFAETLYSLSPSHLHNAIALMSSDQVATTNYDDLLEMAAVATKRYSPQYVVDLPAGTPLPIYPSKMDELLIWKLHGTLPVPDISGNRGTSALQQWLDSESFSKLIATSGSYRSTALSGDLRRLGQLQSELEHVDTLFLFLGTSMTAAELVILRMLYNRTVTRRNLLLMRIASPGDRPIRFSELGIEVIDVPLGLGAGSSRRKLAHIILLELLLDRIRLSDVKTVAAKKELELCYSELPKNDRVGASLRDIAPIVACVGPLQITRVVGLSQPAEQEAFHAPLKATASPDSLASEILISDSGLGQGGNPLVVWDAVDIPSSILAEIGDDHGGDLILKRLESLNWAFFDGVIEILPVSSASGSTEASPGSATESYTCVSWFGARTGFDSFRFLHQSRLPQAKWNLHFERIESVPIVYVTKSMHLNLRQFFDAKTTLKNPPLMILETGGGGDGELEKWVSDRQGIVVASAKTALRWFNQKASIKGDEFGRYVQMATILKCLPGILTQFPPPQFARARGLVLTLGELGSVAWENLPVGWSRPQWVLSRSFENCANTSEPFSGGVTLPLLEIRDALGCGDCARAGFVASMAASLKFSYVSGPLPAGSLLLASAALNWFGIQKVRHFGMDTYREFLKRTARNFWLNWESASPPATAISSGTREFRLGPEEFERFVVYDALDANDNLHPLLSVWLDRFDPDIKSNEDWIRAESQKWSQIRGTPTRPTT